MPDELGFELKQLRTAAKAIGMTLPEALRQKTDELKVRQHIRTLPNVFITEKQYAMFLSRVLGRDPSADELANVAFHNRRPTVRRSDVEFQILLSEQNERCALCGASLTNDKAAETDHIMPLSLGGKNESRNYQILCVKCNRAKGQLLGWVMGAPFFYRFSRRGRRANELSHKVRFCALVRDRGACQERDCIQTSRTSLLHVDLVIPRKDGGRPIFDNVIVRCERHYTELRDQRYRYVLENVRRGFTEPHAGTRRVMPAFDFLNDKTAAD
jgi:5-methylcytosine-specific restriction endonuclease McrA